MDNSKEFNLMLDRAMYMKPVLKEFMGFDRTKNVQDQLQGMVNVNSPEDFARFYNEFCFPWEGEFGIPDYMKYCTSMEQLWLAFVMKEKYNKVWNGLQWGEVH